jgi:mersacidin/lichenicidin family type 2 lantibiotic
MSNADIIRAWKDPEYRLMLPDVPPNPAGQIELADPDLDDTIIVSSGRFVSTHHNCSTDFHCPTGCGVCCRTTV